MANIYDKALTFKKQLEAMDEATLKLISAEYSRTLRKLNAQFQAMAERAQEYTAEHQAPTPYELGRLKEIKKAIEDVEAEMNRLHLDSADKISICQRAYINAVPEHYEKLINGLADEYGAEDVHFSKVNTEAFNKMVGFTSDGSPLADVLNKHSALNKESIISILRHGCLVGENPKTTARKMTKAGYSDASHALLVARTESMRVAQEVGNENFKANGVDMVQWVSGETPYTCAACWAMSGKVFETGKQPHDHPNGRCVFNPYIPELAELDPDLYKHDPEENFAKLSEEEQKVVLGPKRFEMWKNGELNLTDLADTTDSDDYGESIKIRPLKDIADGVGGVPGVNAPEASGSGGSSAPGNAGDQVSNSKNLTKASAEEYNKNELFQDDTKIGDSKKLTSAQLLKVKNILKNENILVEIDGEHVDFIEKKGYLGSCLNEETISLTKNADKSTLCEEIIHSLQYKYKGHYSSTDDTLFEAEAGAILLKLSDDIVFDEIEIEQTRKRVESIKDYAYNFDEEFYQKVREFVGKILRRLYEED